jgi:hypothetical protein
MPISDDDGYLVGVVDWWVTTWTGSVDSENIRDV